MSNRKGQRTAKRRQMKAQGPPAQKPPHNGGGDGNGQPGGGFLFRLNVTTPIADPTVAAALLLNDPKETIQPAREALEFVGQKMEYDEAIELRGQLEQAVFIAIHHNTFAGIGTGFMVDDQRFTVQDVYNKIGEKDGRPMVIFTAHLEPTYVLTGGVRIGAYPEADAIDDAFDNESDGEAGPDLISSGDRFFKGDVKKGDDPISPLMNPIRDADITDDVKDHERDDAAERDDSIDDL